jgi:DNA repair photolyase
VSGDSFRGRGTAENPADRFTELLVERDPELPPEAPPTVVYLDASRSILSRNDSPDIPFEWSANPYRGCEHGCVYCYARPTHEYLGLSAGLDFETKLFAKPDAPRLLREEIAKPSWKPQVVAFSGVTDCYQPVERTLRIMRGCLEVMSETLHPTGIITKSALVTRDVDLLKPLADAHAVLVCITITTLDDELAAVLEPRAARPAKRLETVAALASAGIPVAVMVAPLIPGLTDHEIPAILAAGAERGATRAGWQLLRLPGAVLDLFDQWLARWRPERREKVLHRLRELHGGSLTDSRFGVRMRGEGEWAKQIADLFRISAAKAGLEPRRYALDASSFVRPARHARERARPTDRGAVRQLELGFTADPARARADAPRRGDAGAA